MTQKAHECIVAVAGIHQCVNPYVSLQNKPKSLLASSAVRTGHMENIFNAFIHPPVLFLDHAQDFGSNNIPDSFVK